MDLKFKKGDMVRTLTDRDYRGNTVFPTGTEGVITEVNGVGKLPYRVEKKDAEGDGDFWFYNDGMLELVETDKAKRYKFFVNKLKVFKLVGEVIEKTEGDDELLKDVVYYIECYRKREHLK